MGDPAGVGPELIVRALHSDGGEGVTVYGDPFVLRAAALRLGLPKPEACAAAVVEITRLAGERPGVPSNAGAAAQVAYLEAAIAAIARRELDALCTAPIHKAQARRAGFAFPGHTEFLAERIGGGRDVAMMLTGPHLRVVPVTTHIGLSQVAKVLSPDRIARVCSLTIAGLHHDFGIERPRLAVAGLNPHAGEQGQFGDEETRLIAPAIAAVRKNPLLQRIAFEIAGPQVPDVVFRTAAAPPIGDGRYDAVVAMYHDQALIPLKLIDFDQAVNVTLGLPLPRTSPDHGVAYDLAGTGRARDTSFRAALALARRLTEMRRR